MCGRFAQVQTREESLAYLVDKADRDIAYDSEPLGRYMAPGAKVLLLRERYGQLYLDPVFLGYVPGGILTALQSGCATYIHGIMAQFIF